MFAGVFQDQSTTEVDMIHRDVQIGPAGWQGVSLGGFHALQFGSRNVLDLLEPFEVFNLQKPIGIICLK